MLINVLTKASSAGIMSEDAFQNFSLLLELPDTCQELVVQTLYHDFHYFPELPLELRLHVWRCIFQIHATVDYATEMKAAPAHSHINLPSDNIPHQ
jgi:hypothetical protein